MSDKIPVNRLVVGGNYYINNMLIRVTRKESLGDQVSLEGIYVKDNSPYQETLPNTETALLCEAFIVTYTLVDIDGNDIELLDPNTGDTNLLTLDNTLFDPNNLFSSIRPSSETDSEIKICTYKSINDPILDMNVLLPF